MSETTSPSPSLSANHQSAFADKPLGAASHRIACWSLGHDTGVPCAPWDLIAIDEIEHMETATMEAAFVAPVIRQRAAMRMLVASGPA